MNVDRFKILVDNFSPTLLTETFQRSHDFFRIKENLSFQYKNEQLVDFNQLGYFELEDSTNIIVVCARVLFSLNERAGRKNQYDIAKKILKDNPRYNAGIFVFYDSKGDFRMSLVYAEYLGIKIDYSTFRRFTYFVSKQQTNTTFLQQVAPFNFTNLPELKELFSVEKVTKEFFKKYRDLFLELLEDFEQNEEFKSIVVDKNISTTQDFVKKLMGQIVFLYFVQKKGWLGVRPNENWGMGDQTFLRSVFENCKKADKNYYNDYLEPLFYEALAEKRGEDDYFGDPFNCRIPFLNGGLFESIYDWKKTEIKIHNTTLSKLLDFFDQYNFTVDENTPSDQEISVDPEMLGKIFENLLNVKDRKDKGAFYTPREIVHYMCRESLIQHLISEDTAPEERVRKLFEIKDTDLSVIVENEQKTKSIKELKEISEKIDLSLRNIKIVDPAVGSGAFPMGMLNEISSVRYFLNNNFLHKVNKIEKELTLYDIKKETLENCIYAVDIESGAVEIAKLRFWLALIVEYESNDLNIAPPTLPNLDYKIMQGNSLLEEFEGVKLFDEKLLKQPLINSEIFNQTTQIIQKLQSELISFYAKNPQWMQKGEHKDKPNKVIELENKLREILKQNKKITENSIEQKDLFMSVAESKMIWDEIKSKHERFFSESDREKKKDLRKQIDHLNWLLIESTLEEQKNLSALEKLEKLKDSNTKPFFLWHLYFADVFEEKGGFDIVIGNPPYVSVKHISVSEKKIFSKIFETGKSRFNLFTLFLEKGQNLLNKNGMLSYILPEVLYTNSEYKYIRKYLLEKTQILFISNFSSRVFDASVDTSVIIIKNGHDENSKIKVLVDLTLPITTIKQSEINDIILTKNSNNLKILLDKINFGKEKLSNIIEVQQGIIYSGQKKEDVFSNEKLSDVYKKILDGRDIHKYSINYDLKKENRYIKYTKKLHRPREERLFLANKKLVFPRRSMTFMCAIDTEQFYLLNTAYICLLKNTKYSLEYILGVLNSKVINFLYSRTFIGYQITIPAINLIPIPKINQENKKLIDEIQELAKKIILTKKSNLNVDISNFESQMDELVYKLYDLTPEEIEIVENSTKK